MSTLLAELNDEWRRTHRDHAPTVVEWSTRHPALVGCETLGEVLERVPEQPDAILLALITECSRGDTAAGRVVLQAMLGKLVLMARNTSIGQVDDFIAALWIRIATYPLASRPRRVAANLALDTLKAVRRERPEAPTVTHGLTRAEAPHHSPSDELSAREAIAIGRSLGVITERTGDVLHGVYVEGLTGKQAAERFETTPAMIRYRCSDGARRLARRSQDLLAA